MRNSGLGFYNYHMTLKVYFLIANHHILQIPPQPPSCVLSVTLVSLMSCFDITAGAVSSIHKSLLVVKHHILLYFSFTLLFLSPPQRELHFSQPWKKSLSFYMTAAVTLSANSELMWLYKWQTLPLDGSHFNFLYIFHPQRPSILLRVALSLAQTDKAARATHSSWTHPLLLSLSFCRRNKQSSMRTLWRSWGQSQTTLQWATMDRATLHSSGFVFYVSIWWE